MSRLVAAAMLVVLVVVALLALTGRKPLRDPSHRDWDGVPEVATDSHSLEKAAPLRPIDPEDALLLDFVRQTQTGPLEARLAAIRIVAAQFPPDVWAELLVPLAEDEEAAIREEVAKWFLMTDRPDGSPLRALKRLAADEQAAPKLKIAAADMVTLLGRDPTVQVADAPEVKQYPPGRLIHDFDRVLTDLVAGAYEHPNHPLAPTPRTRPTSPVTEAPPRLHRRTTLPPRNRRIRTRWERSVVGRFDVADRDLQLEADTLSAELRDIIRAQRELNERTREAQIEGLKREFANR